MPVLGAMHSDSWAHDPKHLGFVLSRYKFVGKMLRGKDCVLEVGCGDTTGARIVRTFVGTLHGIDTVIYSEPCIKVFKHDMLDGPAPSGILYDAAYALDVLEHIAPENENKFINNIINSLGKYGVLIIGMPSKESQAYASPQSLERHINCKTEEELRNTLSHHVSNIFTFGMSDEVVHTGFGALCHYRLAVCVR